MKDILDGARSTASTLGTQPAAENTPTVFDFVSLYYQNLHNCTTFNCEGAST